MKKQFKYLVLYFPLLISLSAFSGNSQNQFTHIASKENNSCNGNCTMLDIPQLNGNPKAIIFVTQKEQGLNPHPIGVYYFKGRWNIMNLDQAGIPAGSEFEVEYFINPDKEHFQYLIKKGNFRQKDGSAFIDHPALNNHPDAQFSVFHSWVPEAKEFGNRQEVQVQYDPGADKWVLSIVSNMVNKSLPVNSAYNINITSAGKSNTNPTNTNTNLTSNAGGFTGPILSIYMSVWVNGNKLPGQNIRVPYMDQTQILDYDMGVVTAREAASGRSAGRRQHEPFTIKCEMGYTATIMLFDALVNAKPITLTLDFISQDPSTAAEGLNYSVKLTGALVTSFKEIFEEIGLNSVANSANARKSYNEIKFSYTKIEFIDAGGLSAQNSW